jgi:hypothetical protein
MSRIATGILVFLALAGSPSSGANAAEAERGQRRDPRVFTPVEVRMAPFRGQVETFLFNKDFSKMLVLTKDANGEYDLRMLNPKELAQRPNVRLARRPFPIRMVLIAGSFPYKKQIEEFRTKLGLPSSAAVLSEAIGDGKEKQPAFRFLGVNVQRRTLDVSGRPKTEYRKLDVEGEYKLWLMNCGQPFQAEEPGVAKVRVPGLFMHRFRLFGGGRPAYPPLEKRLKLLQQSIKALPDAPAEGRFGPFAPSDRRRKPSEAPALPEYCLLRVLDLDIKPNTIYQYRLQVRMANPNYGRKDVDKATAECKELLSDWLEVPGALALSPEHVYYVVDEKTLNKRDNPSKDDPRWEMWDQKPTLGSKWSSNSIVGSRTCGAILGPSENLSETG